MKDIVQEVEERKPVNMLRADLARLNLPCANCSHLCDATDLHSHLDAQVSCALNCSNGYISPPIHCDEQRDIFSRVA